MKWCSVYVHHGLGVANLSMVVHKDPHIVGIGNGAMSDHWLGLLAVHIDTGATCMCGEGGRTCHHDVISMHSTGCKIDVDVHFWHP